MPGPVLIDPDEYTVWSEDNPENFDDNFYGGIGLIGGVLFILWDEGQDSVIYPPEPKKIRPPNGSPPTPPRVKRPKVPPPYYP